MWEDYENNYVMEDALAKLKNEIDNEAEACSFEVRLIGGLLKFTPVGVYTEVMLELEQPNFINHAVLYKHRRSELTSKHKGKAISTKWVLGFLKHNSNEAKKLIEQKEKEDKAKEVKSAKDANNMKIAAPSKPIQKCEESKYGYSAGKSICSVCNGDGGAAGQCYKCEGSGWAYKTIQVGRVGLRSASLLLPHTLSVKGKYEENRASERQAI